MAVSSHSIDHMVYMGVKWIDGSGMYHRLTPIGGYRNTEKDAVATGLVQSKMAVSPLGFA
ncbi:hypothetical protein GCM10025858_14390 [Alicyclobacillus sacchari]|nr:hypothetical protein GCM10025858_14390 [Alicyclobacillus sacchari]